MVTLFPDQVEVKTRLRSLARSGYKRPLLVAPCGFGKGTTAGDIILEAVGKGSKVWFIVNRRELVKDNSRRLTKLGVYHGILMGAQTRGTHMDVIIASKDTLRNRLKSLPVPDLVFVDEAHLFTSDKDQELFNYLESNGSFLIFMTATPWLLNGKGMDQICDSMVEGPQVSTLIEQKRLAVPEIYSTGQPDMSKVHVSPKTGDYDERESAEVMRDRVLMGDMVKHWRELAEGLPTVGFAVNKETAEEYAKTFREAGISSIAVNDQTPDRDRHKADGSIELGRDTIWDKLRSGEIRVVWSVGVISYGWDVPEVRCIILARPTKSLALNLQQIGRGLRICAGKTHCIILDHAGNTVAQYPGGSIGLPDMARHWSLRGWKRKRGNGQKEEVELNDLPLVCPVDGVNPDTFIECPKPKHVLKPGTRQCPVCMYEFSRPRGDRLDIEIDTEAKLEKVQTRVYIYPEATGDTQKDAVLDIAKARNYNPKWITYKTKDLDKAREEYRQRYMAEPKDHWTASMIQSMLKQDAGQRSLEEVEASGLEDWLAGK